MVIYRHIYMTSFAKKGGLQRIFIRKLQLIKKYFVLLRAIVRKSFPNIFRLWAFL